MKPFPNPGFAIGIQGLGTTTVNIAASELLQHEIDHLDGVLAIDRAIDSRHIVYKSEYERWKTHGELVL